MINGATVLRLPMDLIDRRDDHDRDGTGGPRDGSDPRDGGPDDRRARVALDVDRPPVDRRRRGDQRAAVDRQQPTDCRRRDVPGSGGDPGP